MAARINEKYIFGAIWSHVTAQVAGMTFYLPEVEPAVSGINYWTQIEVEQYAETACCRIDWMALGRVAFHLSVRKSAGNVYTGREYAKRIIAACDKDTPATITVSMVVNGYIKWGQAISVPLGEEDGIIMHRVTVDFQVFSDI